MKTCRTLLCATVILLSAAVGKGQSTPPDYSIHFSARGSGSDFRVELTRHATVVSLRYGRLDSVQHTALRQDPRFAASMAALKATQQTAAESTRAAQRLAILFEQYKVYRWDSLQVATAGHPALVHTLDSVYQSPAAHLERAEANWGRIVLDGTSVRVVVRTGHTIEKNLAVRSPDPVSHPQLYHLLHQALELYRQQQPAAILDRLYTNGY